MFMYDLMAINFKPDTNREMFDCKMSKNYKMYSVFLLKINFKGFIWCVCIWLVKLRFISYEQCSSSTSSKWVSDRIRSNIICLDPIKFLYALCLYAMFIVFLFRIFCATMHPHICNFIDNVRLSQPIFL